MARLEFSSVQVSANDRTILKDISFIFEGTRLAVIGANGSGKSTLLRLINGLRQPTRGTIQVDGADVGKSANSVRRRIGFVFQNPEAQILMPTVEEDIRFGLQQWDVASTDQDALVEDALEQFNLAHLRHQPCHYLSGGEKQRLALAAVMVLSPDVLLLDEPTTLLDLAALRDFRRRLAEFEQTVVMATHNFEDIEGFDQALVLHKGELIHTGTIPESIASYENSVLA